MHPKEITEKNWKSFLVKARNEIAVVLSIVPGLGHIYKGYVLPGLALMLLAPVAVFSGLICGALTLGLGLFLPVVFWVATGWTAYQLPDHRKHHLVN